MTPFVDDINDQISIYVEHLANGQLRLSDDVYAISNLSFMGTELPMYRKKNLSKILRQFNIKLIEEETLAIEGDEPSFPKINFLPFIRHHVDKLSVTN